MIAPAAEAPPRPKILLVGEHNPYGPDPRFALYPSPAGCAGERLCEKILGMSASAYLSEFDRVNLVTTPKWSAVTARIKANEIIVVGQRDRLVLLGAKVAAAFGLPSEPFQFHDRPWGRALVLPHPSGRCRAWNAAGAFERARDSFAAAFGRRPGGPL